jgi:hypothetical protein
MDEIRARVDAMECLPNQEAKIAYDNLMRKQIINRDNITHFLRSKKGIRGEHDAKVFLFEIAEMWQSQHKEFILDCHAASSGDYRTIPRSCNPVPMVMPEGPELDMVNSVFARLSDHAYKKEIRYTFDLMKQNIFIMSFYKSSAEVEAPAEVPLSQNDTQELENRKRKYMETFSKIRSIRHMTLKLDIYDWLLKAAEFFPVSNLVRDFKNSIHIHQNATMGELRRLVENA